MSGQGVVPCREVTVTAVQRLAFGVYSDDEVKRLSVKRITNPVTLDSSGNALADGLYDPSLGIQTGVFAARECVTCRLNQASCPGHFGHIELPVPVYNPLLFKELLQLLKSCCLNCGHLRIPAPMKASLKRKLMLLLTGDLAAAAGVSKPVKRSKAADDGDIELAGIDADPGMSDIELKDQHSRADGPITSNILSELDGTISSMFSAINQSCPVCKCVSPKVKRLGKNAVMLKPLSVKHAERNANHNFSFTALKGIANEVLHDAEADATPEASKSDEEKDEEDKASDDMSVDEDSKKDRKAEEALVVSSSGEKRKRGELLSDLQATQPVGLVPAQVHAIIAALFAVDNDLLSLIFQAQGAMEGRRCSKANADMFFIRTLAVPPIKFRPVSELNGITFEHPQNVIMAKVLQACLDINDIQGKQQEQPEEEAQEAEGSVQLFLRANRELQNHVSQLIDSTASENRDQLQGVRQLLEKKEGLFRMNMMGKRVNFAARSVISPDPNISTGEIGVPPYFAMRLSFPETVTPLNHSLMRKLVLNGADKHPGAVAVEDPVTGTVLSLHNRTEAQRQAIAKQLLTSHTGGRGSMHGKRASRLLGRGQEGGAGSGGWGKIVYRHLIDGDCLLTNRQPTLHKPGLMAHRTRVLHGERTIRMHYANCATFNADFDGDEINLHLPQEQQGRAEGYEIVHADHQFKVPTDGKPVRGLIQDHVIGAVRLTKRDTFLTREEFSSLAAIACVPETKGLSLAEAAEPGSLHTFHEAPLAMPAPAILHPKPLWTGKQVINTLLEYYTRGKPAATFSARTRVTQQEWGYDAIASETSVYVRRGYMCHGTIDKAQYGSGGLLHAVQELYGGPIAGAVTSSLSRLLTVYIQRIGFSCGMADLLLTQQHEEERRQKLQAAEGAAITAAAAIAEVKLPPLPPTIPAPVLRAAEHAVRSALRPRYRQSALVATVVDQRVSSALNPVASSVTKACFPQGLTRPFLKNCMSQMTTTGAKGGLVNFSQISAMLGQQDLEGRRVPRMASGKTLPCFHAFDAGARSGGFVGDRFLSGLRPQEYYFHCMAGRDGLVDTAVKTARSGYLQRCMIKNLEGLALAYDSTVRDASDRTIVQFVYGDDGLDVLDTSYLTNFPFLHDNADRVLQDLDWDGSARGVGDGPRAAAADALWERRREALEEAAAEKVLPRGASVKARADFSNKENLPCVQAELPLNVLGSVSELFWDKLAQYVEDHGLQADERFKKAMLLRYMRSLAAPGESVGVLAGQSIGEPSTQMTLNTFHMAGRGEANVTLGIPRLRELLMTAARVVATPVMTLPLRKGKRDKDAHRLAAQMRKLRLAECLKELSVEQAPVVIGSAGVRREYTIHLGFHDMEAYPEQTGLTWQELKATVAGGFAWEVERAVVRHFKRAAFNPEIDSVAVTGPAGPSRGGGAEEGEEEGAANRPAVDNDGGDDDADENKEDNDEFAEAKDGYREEAEQEYGTSSDDEPDPADVATGGDVPAVVAAGTNAEAQEEEEEEDEAEAEAEKDDAPAWKRARTAHRLAAQMVSSIGAKYDICVEHTPVDAELRCEVYVSVPVDAPKVLITEVAEAAAVAALVRSTPKISNVYVIAAQKRGDVPSLQTDGINFAVAWRHNADVDPDRATCNDVMHMLNVYGVEAARAALVTQVREVFGAYGISVDARHLSLIADFMTHAGGYRGCSRHGISTCASPLLKMSFETSAAFLRDAAMTGAVDHLGSAASRIVLGQPVGLGTGAVGLQMQV
eukprot:jgi/Ulvmu1/10079/UM006_0026.1